MSGNVSKTDFWVPLAGIVLLAGFPYFSEFFGLDYYTGFVMRLMILMIIVTSLNFLLGYGGMIAHEKRPGCRRGGVGIQGVIRTALRQYLRRQPAAIKAMQAFVD